MKAPEFTPAFDDADGSFVAMPQELVRLHIRAFEEVYGYVPRSLNVSDALFHLLLDGSHLVIYDPGNEYTFDGIDLYCDCGLPCAVYSPHVSEEKLLAQLDAMNQPPDPAATPTAPSLFPCTWMEPFLEIYERNGNVLASATIVGVRTSNVRFQIKNHPTFAMAFRLAQLEVGERIWQSIKHRVPLPG